MAESPSRIAKLAGYPYAVSAAMIAAVTGIGFAAAPILHSPNIDMLYLLLVLVSALAWGQRPAMFTAIVSAVIFDFCFIPPYYTFTITDIPYLVTLIGFVAVAFATSTLAARARELRIEQEARARAEAASQAKDEMLNKIAHELRAPLTAVAGWTQVLAQARDDEQRLARSLAGLEHSAEALTQLVNDLMDSSRAKAGKLTVNLEPVMLAPIVSRALDVVTVAAENKSVRVQAEIEPVGEVLGDARRLEQTVINLISNAIKFTPRDGRVVVRLERVGGDARLVVSDTGAGISREFLPHLFEPFSQGDPKNPHGGLGLGLAIVKHLVDAHHGSIRADSAGQGRGATFTVTLPLLQAHFAAATARTIATAAERVH